MYSRQEISLLNQEFWTTFGQYMSPIASAEGEKINWINYKTHVKNIRFVMQVENNTATVSIELSHKDPDLQRSAFEKFMLLKKILQQFTREDWQWELFNQGDNGNMVSIISIRRNNLTILNRSDWPELISFFKNHLLALDKFWCENKFVFE